MHLRTVDLNLPPKRKMREFKMIGEIEKSGTPAEKTATIFQFFGRDDVVSNYLLDGME